MCIYVTQHCRIIKKPQHPWYSFASSKITALSCVSKQENFVKKKKRHFLFKNISSWSSVPKMALYHFLSSQSKEASSQRKAATLICTTLFVWRKHPSPGAQQAFLLWIHLTHSNKTISFSLQKYWLLYSVTQVSLRHQRHEKCQNVLVSHRITHSVYSPGQWKKVRWSAWIWQ